MNPFDDTPDDDWESDDWESVSLRSAPIPLDQLVQDVYAGSEPETQEHMLAHLVGKVFEAAPVPVQIRLLDHLLRPVGVLALIVIANGVFGKMCLRGGLPETVLSPGEVQTVRSGDVTALAEHVLHTSSDTVNSLSQVLANVPALAGSAAATALLSLLRQRSLHRRSSDDLLEDGPRRTGS